MPDGITLTRPGGSSVTLTDDLEVSRAVGRPQASIKPTPDARGRYRDPPKPARDVFEISGEFTTGTPAQDATTLQEDIILPPLGDTALTLTFENGLYGYASDFDVFPLPGDQSARVSWAMGQTGQVRVDTLSLRVVDNST